jgi:hypothetical protein
MSTEREEQSCATPDGDEPRATRPATPGPVKGAPAMRDTGWG